MPPSPEQHREITDRFMRAVDAGDVEALVGLLAADAVSYSDGGGVVTAARKPIEGRARIARFLTKVTAPDKRPEGVEVEAARVNGLPGYIVRPAARWCGCCRWRSTRARCARCGSCSTRRSSGT